MCQLTLVNNTAECARFVGLESRELPWATSGARDR